MLTSIIPALNNTVVMKKIIQTTLLFAFLFGAAELIGQQDNPVITKVHNAIRQANAATLASCFHSTLDLEIGDTDGNFSKNQAEMIVKDFFTRNPVKSFTIKHQGSSDDGSKYSIGLYVTKSNLSYRVYVLLKQSDEGLRINQLQFEED